MSYRRFLATILVDTKVYDDNVTEYVETKLRSLKPIRDMLTVPYVTVLKDWNYEGKVHCKNCRYSEGFPDCSHSPCPSGSFQSQVLITWCQTYKRTDMKVVMTKYDEALDCLEELLGWDILNETFRILKEGVL